MDLSSLFRPVRAFFARLFTGGTPRAGLDISDQALRLLFERKGSWQLETVPLAPGTLERGVIKDRPALMQALGSLHERVAPHSPGSRFGTHVSLSSALSYIQLVPIPPVSPKELQSAVQLNVQVSAPVALSELAWGWEPLPGPAGGSAVLAAWVSRSTADDLVGALAEANFLPASLEPKSLSVARLVRTLAPEATAAGAFLLASFDESGVTLGILDLGSIRFQYARSWSEVRGSRGELTYASLDEFLRREAAQVVGYYAQRGGTRLTEVLLATQVFKEEITVTLTDMGMTVRTLGIGDPPFPLPGYGAYGAALRSSVLSGDDDPELSLLGAQVRDWIRRELALRVARFWTIFTPASVGLLLATYGAAFLFMNRVAASLESFQSNASPVLLAELADREARVSAFNQSVAELASAQAQVAPRSPQLRSILDQAQRSGVAVTRLSLLEAPERSSVAGITGGEDQLLSFKRSLEADPSLARVLLPVTEVRSGPDGISFSMTFDTSFAAAGKVSP